MGRLFDLIDEHRDAQRYPPSYSAIASKVGVSRQTLLNWRNPSTLIQKTHLEKLAGEIRVSYRTVLEALLDDIDYLHPSGSKAIEEQEEGTRRAADAAQKTDEVGSRRSTPRPQEVPPIPAGLAADDPKVATEYVLQENEQDEAYDIDQDKNR